MNQLVAGEFPTTGDPPQKETAAPVGAGNGGNQDQSTGDHSRIGRNPQPVTLDALADRPQWVAWRAQPRKVPYSPHTDREAKSNDPATWGTLKQARECASRILAGGQSGGVGLMLGAVSGRPGLFLGGVDLDGCHDPATGAFQPWATAVLERLGSYAEVSPSTKGAKLFFTYDAADLPELRRAMGTEWRKPWSRGSHCEIALDLGGRYYAVTRESIPLDDAADLLGADSTLQPVATSDLLWLIEDHGPAFADKGEGKTVQDESESGAAFRKAVNLHLAGEPIEAFERWAANHPWGDYERNPGRAVERTWGRAQARAGVIALEERNAEPDFDHLGPAPEKSKSGTLQFYRVGDLQNLPDAHDFVEGVLFDRQLSVIFGTHGTGKTFFTLDLAMHVSLGREWQSRGVEQGGVLYIALEGVDGIKKRHQSWCRWHKIKNPESLPIAFSAGSLDLRKDKRTRDSIVTECKTLAAKWGFPVRWIIIDTLNWALAGGNENASEDMGALVAGAHEIRAAANAHVTLIHHSGKDEARGARGHSSLAGNIDTEIGITRDGRRHTAKLSKQKEAEDGIAWAFMLESVDLGGVTRWGKPIRSLVALPDILEAFEDPEVKLTPRQQDALNVLRKRIDGEQGGGQRGLSALAWRGALQEAGWPGGGQGADTLPCRPDSFAREFRRAKKTLEEQCFITVEGDNVRLCDE